MEVRIESMICMWDDKIPALFIEFVNRGCVKMQINNLTTFNL